jgi:carboxyl-terminal processing protease
VEKAAGGVAVIRPLEDSPAAAGGLRAGDLITHIDGVALAERDLLDVRRLRGERNSVVELVVLKNSTGPAQKLTLRRTAMQSPPAIAGSLLEPGIGFVVAEVFDVDAAVELDKTIRRLGEENKAPLKGLVLDLRECVGGLFQPAVATRRSSCPKVQPWRTRRGAAKAQPAPIAPCLRTTATRIAPTP